MSVSKQTPTKGAITKKAVFVSVTRALAGEIPEIGSSLPLADIARGFWHVESSKIKQCELLVAVDKGVVSGIWEIDVNFGWHPMSAAAIPTRNVNGMVVDPRRQYCRVIAEVLPEFKGKNLASVMNGMRMYGPVMYNF